MGDYLRDAYRAPQPPVARRRRPDLVLAIFELWCRLEDKLRGPECPICRERSRVLDAHIYVNHDPTREH